MSVAVAVSRQFMLTARTFDLQFQLQMIAQAKMQLSQTSGQLFTLSDALDPELPFAQMLMERMAVLQTLDKGLELQSQRIQMALQAVQAELESIKKMAQENIKRAFSYMA